MSEPGKFDAISIKLASPEKILSWAPGRNGEVTSPGTLDVKTLLPEAGGLFNEVTFGPQNDFQCACGFTKGYGLRGTRCVKCGVEITRSEVRRRRMGRITLVVPAVHIWYYKNTPSPIAILLGIGQRELEEVIYYKSYIITDTGTTALKYKQVISITRKYELAAMYGEDSFKAATGAQAIRDLLCAIDLEEELEKVKAQLCGDTDIPEGVSKLDLEKKDRLLRNMIASGNRPEWMVMTVIPVLPPDLRPLIVMSGNRTAVSDMNAFYKRIISRNERLKKLIAIGSPEIILLNEKRMLQAAVDALFDNSRSPMPSKSDRDGRLLKSLTDHLKGKQGLFRKNLLGKRVDYSGRSVIVVGPNLKIYQCGLPKAIALELFKPFIIGRLYSKDLVYSISHAETLIKAGKDNRVWQALDELMKEYVVMLNRAPTLHRIGIQAFEPVLVEGNAIRLHPLVCTAFNADFDGDQMGVHLPISHEAQEEARTIMLSPLNLIKPSDGTPVAVPSQDMVLGIYYLTQERAGEKGEGMLFKDLNEAFLAYENKYITLHSKIGIRITKVIDGETRSKIVRSTYGRFIFNGIVPQTLGFVNREEDQFSLEIDCLVGKKKLKQILEKVFEKLGREAMADFLDKVKDMGYKYSTIGALTVSVSDMIIPDEKPQMIAEAEGIVKTINIKQRRGLLTEEERYKQVIDTWQKTDDKLTKALLAGMPPTNNLKMMADSGARGSDKQIKQLTGMRGLMADATGHTLEMPIKSNFREGLNVLEYFVSAHGSRKGMSDTALRTADAGYMTRRLVDVAQEIVITDEDCSVGMDIPYMEVSDINIKDGKSVKNIESLETRLTGRFLAESIETETETYESNTLITPSAAKDLADYARSHSGKIKIRSVLTCRCERGVCTKCYGINLATGQLAAEGDAVGVIGAQSIGEPGTQLTMRTFHTGGVAGGDITQGLPRVEEIFECRPPKGQAVIAETDGICEPLENTGKVPRFGITSPEGKKYEYRIPYSQAPTITEKMPITAGTPLCTGSIDPHELFKICGPERVMDYMLQEVLKVYTSQAVDINDKHIEVIIRQLFKLVRITDPGDSDFLKGEEVKYQTYLRTNRELEEQGKRPAEGKRLMLGLTRAGIRSQSFMAAASFQNTPKVLADAAVKGKTDHLENIKENVIIGGLIPAGTGTRRTEIHVEKKETNDWF